MDPSKSREHRMRVLQNQMKLAAERGVATRVGHADPQMKMPLIVEVKGNAATKPRVRRSRGGSRKGQPELGEL
jgi:hypothetical protein